MTKEDNIIVPRWLLERIENTLRIQHNINIDKTTGETCQDRNIKESLNGVRKLLKGEELTGGERLERLQPSLPPNIDEAADKFAHLYDQGTCDGIAQDCFKAGAEWATNDLFENNRLKDCEALNEEDYKLESDFVDAHIKENHRVPTFLDAIKYGAEWMAKQGEVFEGIFKAGDAGYPDVHIGEQYSIEYIKYKPKGVEPGDEVIVQIRKK